MSFPISKLIENQKEVITIACTATLGEAMTKMVAYDFSQLPIVDGRGKLVGIISEQSITNLLFHTHGEVPLLGLTVDHCKAVPSALPPEADIFEALRMMQDTPALVVAQDNKPIGIVTYYDTTNFFRENNEGLMYVEDIEVGLRKYVEDIYSTDEALTAALINVFGSRKQNPTRANKEYEALTFSELKQFVTHEKNWEAFEPYLQPRDLLLTVLNDVRPIRNQLAHFRERIDSVQRHTLRNARSWLADRPRVQRPETLNVAVVDNITVQAEVIRLSGKAQGRYAPLKVLLEERPASEKSVLLAFAQIEELLDAPLPAAAYEHRSWWANTSSGHTQASYWMEAGSRVEDVDLEGRTVVFGRSRDVRYKIFFARLLDRVEQLSPGLTNGVSAGERNWLDFASSRPGFRLGWSFTKKRTLRVELTIDVGDKEKNHNYFDAIKHQSVEIEAQLGFELGWDPLNPHRSCRVGVETQGTILDSVEVLDTLIEWAAQTMTTFRVPAALYREAA